MNSIPSVSETLSLLEKLRTAIRDFAAREDKLSQNLRAKTAAEHRACEFAGKEQQTRHAERTAQAEADYQATEQRCMARFHERKKRINEAHKMARRKASEDVAEFEGRRKNKLQQNAMEAERRRQKELSEAAAAMEGYKEKITETAKTFALLEHSAAKSFSGYPGFHKLLLHEREWPEPDASGDEHQLLAEVGRLERKTQQDIKKYLSQPLVALFRILPLWLLLILFVGFAAAVPALNRFAGKSLPPTYAYVAVGAAILVALLYFIGKKQATSGATAIAADLARARRLQDVGFEKAVKRHQQEQNRIKTDFENTHRLLDEGYKKVVKEAIALRDQAPRKIDDKAYLVNQKNEELHRAKLERLEDQHRVKAVELEQDGKAALRQLAATRDANIQRFDAAAQSEWQALEKEWNGTIRELCERLQQVNAEAARLFPSWDLGRWKNWTPPDEFKNAARFGELSVDLPKFAEAMPKDPRFTLPCPAQLSVPLALTYPREGSILFETKQSGGDEAVAAINNIIFRLLSTMPPGKVSFTILDPVGLGQSFAGIMHLADYEEGNINSRIWTQTTQIEEKLAELSEHMEKVIQMYLRNEYETIAEYNAQAGSIAEKYHFLVVASFPSNFSDVAAKRLRNIAASGARCGVYTLIHWDQRHPSPQDFVPDELRKNSVCVVRTEKGFELANQRLNGTQLRLDEPPSPEFATWFLHEVGKSSKDSNRVEVPFEQVAPGDDKMWTEETTEEVQVAIGRTGATKLQYLTIGKGTRQHALIAGKTGSGKSTLFHLIITNLALWCSPEQIEFYLVDFKKGVEFKCYGSRRLPHARVVAIESDRQFGLSVLERVDAELRRRGDMFRKLGVQDLPGYKRAGGTEPVPRSLLMIDEFQEFFVEEDRISQGAAVLLDRIVRQGRAFGIHVILGSQTLGGAYTLARATIGQMVIRIALQCNEADAYLIMDQDNPAPRLLTRPGEGIYNDSAGAIEGNSPFQAVWLSEDVRDAYLAKIRERADQNGKRHPGPFVFEGNAPADIRENGMLNALLRAAAPAPAPTPRIWLGAPNSIKGPTEAVFQRRSGNNVLVVGQNEEPTLAMLGVALVSLAAQYPPGAARFVFLDSSPPNSPQREFFGRIAQAIPNQMVQPKPGEVPEVLNGLLEDLKQRQTEDHGEAASPIFLIIHGLENFKKLKPEDEFSFSSSEGGPNPATVFQTLITEGPSHGIHVIATCDTFNNVSRFLGRKALSEFSQRVLFQMSASDSAALIDAPDAGTLGLHRALLYNDREGYIETFRPYARPGNDWIEEVARDLAETVKT